MRRIAAVLLAVTLAALLTAGAAVSVSAAEPVYLGGESGITVRVITPAVPAGLPENIFGNVYASMHIKYLGIRRSGICKLGGESSVRFDDDPPLYSGGDVSGDESAVQELLYYPVEITVNNCTVNIDGETVEVIDTAKTTISYAPAKGKVYVELNVVWTQRLINIAADRAAKQEQDRLEQLGNVSGKGESMVRDLIDTLFGITDAIYSWSGIANADDDAVALSGTVIRIYNAVYSVSFLIMILFWLGNFTGGAVSLDLWKKDAWLPYILRLIWGITILSISLPVLNLIFSLTHQVTSAVLTENAIDRNVLLAQVDQLAAEAQDDTWLIGPIITFFKVLYSLPKMLLTLLLDIVFGLTLRVVLMVRTMKLGIMQGISPMFFATSSSEKGSVYTKNFLTEYIVICGQTLIAAVTLECVNRVIAALPTTPPLMMTVGATVAYIAGMLLVSGSAKFLRSLLKGFPS